MKKTFQTFNKQETLPYSFLNSESKFYAKTTLKNNVT